MNRAEAEAGLASIASAQRRAGELRGYRHAASVIAAWGVAWLIGFSASQFLAEAAAWLWPIVVAGALAWTLTRPRTGSDVRAILTWCVAVASIALLLIVIRADQRLAGMIFGLVLAASYTILGIWSGRRFALLGAVALASCCAGWWLFPEWLFLALALGCGGTMLVGGLWLRRP